MSKKENLSTTSTGSEKGTTERRKHFGSQLVIPIEDFIPLLVNLGSIKRLLENPEYEGVAKKHLDRLITRMRELRDAEYTAQEVLNSRVADLEELYQESLSFFWKAHSSDTNIAYMSGEDLLKMYKDMVTI